MRLPLPLITTFAASVLLAGCKEEAENHTVEYFIANPAERATMLATCEVSDGSSEEANCINADLAEQQSKRDQDQEGFRKTFGEPSFD